MPIAPPWLRRPSREPGPISASSPSKPTSSRARRRSLIDYAVMEKTTRAAVVPVSYGWSDVGSWQAVWDLVEKDPAGNASQGTAVFVELEELICFLR